MTTGPTLGDYLGLVLLLLFVGGLGGMHFQKLLWQMKRGNRQRYDRKGKVLPFQPKPDKISDAADQLRTVMKADFKAQPLLNKSEARLFKAIDKWVIELRPGWQVMAQVSLGEIRGTRSRNLWASWVK